MTTQTQTQIERTKSPASRRRLLGTLLTLAATVLAFAGCTGVERSPRIEAPPALASGSEAANQHATLEAAARAALAEAWSDTALRNRDLLRVGAILQTEDEFIWLEPQSSQRGPGTVVRLGLHANHAATYIVHPRTGSAAVNRANEHITNYEKRLVDRIDPLHRPVFILTPSGRLLAYSHGRPVVEVASMRALKTSMPWLFGAELEGQVHGRLVSRIAVANPHEAQAK